MSNLSVDELRNSMDSDEGFKAKRRALVFTSLLLLALAVSGAEIKEANTFIFKIEFSNHAGLTFLLAMAVLFSMLRYYAYAEKYHAQLFGFWSARLLSDHTIFYYDRDEDEVRGLLGKRVDVWGGDEPGIQEPRYKKTGMLRRSIEYTSYGNDERYGDYTYNRYVDLNEYSERWAKKEFLQLLKAELGYRVEAFFRYRETLDLASPYLLGFISLATFFGKRLI